MFDWDSLPKVEVPYIPEPITDDKVYTLVLDLDETLIHFVDNGMEFTYNRRPGWF